MTENEKELIQQVVQKNGLSNRLARWTTHDGFSSHLSFCQNDTKKEKFVQNLG